MKLTKRSIRFKDDSCGVSWFYLHAGFLTVWFGSWTFHLFPERVFRRNFLNMTTTATMVNLNIGVVVGCILFVGVNSV